MSGMGAGSLTQPYRRGCGKDTPGPIVNRARDGTPASAWQAENAAAAAARNARVLPRVDISNCAYFIGQKKCAP